MTSTAEMCIDVIGAGGMGRSLALRLGLHGHRTRLWSRRPAAEVTSQFRRDLASLAKARPDADLGSLSSLLEVRYAGDLALADAWLVIEVVEETLAAKSAALRAISDAAGPDTAIGTGTSTFCPARLAEFVYRPKRLFGVHPFSPVALSSVVEFCRPQDADPGLAAAIVNLLRDLDLEVVEVPDQPAYLFNRFFLACMAAAIDADDTGKRFADIDRLVRLGNNVQRGPFELMDLVGLETLLACFQNLSGQGYPGFNSASARLRQLVAQGRTGARRQAGFYQYPPKEEQ